MKNPNVVWIVAACVIGYLGVLGAIIALGVRVSRRRLQQQAEAFEATLAKAGARRIGEGPNGGFYKGTEIEYELDGSGRVFLNAYYASRYWMRVNLRIPMAQPLPWVSIYPEGGVQRFGKRIGLNREIQTGDATFDEQAYIDTIAADDDVLPLLTPAVRGAIGKLLGAGYKVQFSLTGVETFQLVPAGKTVDASQTVVAAQLLRTIADALPKTTGGTYAAAPKALAVIPVVMLGVSWLGALAIAVLTRSAIDQTLDATGRVIAFFGAGGLGWVVYVLVIAMLLRGRSYTLPLVMFGALFGVLAVPFSVGALVLYANRELDTSSPVMHTATIVHRSSYKSDYRLHIESWREPGKREYITVPSKTYRATAIGDRMTLAVHAGKLGWTWGEIVTIDHARAPTPTQDPTPTPTPTQDPTPTPDPVVVPST